MTNRRRLLLSYLANSFKYLPYSYEYLYYGLVPNTIDSKQVRNKAKVSKLYGNSVVENQLVNRNVVSFTDNGITSTFDKQTGVYSLSGQTTTAYFQITPSTGFSVVSGHRYLMIMNILTNPNNVSLRFCDLNDGNFRTPATTKGFSTNIVVRSGANDTHTLGFEGSTFTSGTDMSGITFTLEIIDLTQKYPFNTPTSLTDNRVQAILNRGYIPYNLGELKSVDIGEISSYVYPKELSGAKSLLIYSGNREIATSSTYVNLYKNFGSGTGVEFSLFTNGQLSHKFFGYSEIEYNENNVLTAMHFAAQGTISSSYIIESHSKICSVVQPSQISVSMYLYGTLQPTITLGNHFLIDLTELGIDTLTAQQVYELLTPEIIDKLANGEALNNTLQTIPFKYQGSGVGTAHDTYELTKTSHVFTKNMSRVDLGTPNWYYDNTTSHETMFSDVISNIKAPANTDVVNGICAKYQPVSWDNLYSHSKSGIAVQPNGRLRVYASDMGTNPTDFKTAMNGVLLEYQLATPQVITIPRKHLGIVRIRDLSWTSQTAYGTKEFYNNTLMSVVAKPSANDQIANIYCPNFMTTYRSNGTANSGIAIGTNGLIVIKCTDSDTDFLNKYGDYLIFYETENEVADITDTFDIQSGGNINTNWFTWVENQNAKELNASNNWYCQSTYGSLSNATERSILYTRNSTTQSGTTSFLYQVIAGGYAVVSGHKYLAYGKFTASSNCSIRSHLGAYGSLVSLSANTKKTLTEIITATSNGYIDFAIDNGYPLAVNETILCEDIMVIDLTVGFHDGDIPTDINDYRIQYILEHGYIPTNLTGTEKHIQNEVLANADFLMKCK